MKTAILKKIVVFGVVSAVISLLLACIGFGFVEFGKIRSEKISQINSQLDILAYNLQPTLLFDDKDAADKTLRALRADSSVNSVRLFKANGEELTSYIHSTRKGDIQRIKFILYNGKLIGWLKIDSVYLGVKEKIWEYLFICLLIIIISIPASHMISAPIRQQVYNGVLQLEEQSNMLRMLAAQLTNTEQMERKRIAAIIHDHLQQFLVACKLQLGLASREMGKAQYEKVVTSLNRMDELINEATNAAKTLTVELRPPVLYEDGLAAGFKWLANKFKQNHDLDISLKLEDFSEKLPDTLKIMVFESVKELLFNIVKYADVKTAELSLKYEADCLIVLVTDKGKGFDPQKIERISSDKGFGLFSIRERLKLLNGHLKILSEPMKGTRVEIRIPVTMAEKLFLEEKILTPALLHKEGKERKINILLVDDHKIVREGIANILKENASFNIVAQAEDGVEAIEKAENFRPDIVIMDINMPKLNGIEATRIIKNKFPYMDIIALSVQDENDISESMKKAGAVAMLNKAGDPKELIQMIINCKLKKDSLID